MDARCAEIDQKVQKVQGSRKSDGHFHIAHHAIAHGAISSNQRELKTYYHRYKMNATMSKSMKPSTVSPVIGEPALLIILAPDLSCMQ